MTTFAPPMTHDELPREPAPSADSLPLVGCRLLTRARGGFARVRLEQTFRNETNVPLHVTYKLPLPADGAVGAFAFRIGDRRIVGTVDEKRRARERYEEAIVEGKTAALLEEETSSLFTQELGNVPPGADVVAEIVIDQPLAFVDDGWEWRFPLAAAPRYLGNLSSAEADRVSFSVAVSGTPVRASLALEIDEPLAEGRSPDSPSHSLVARERGDRLEVIFGRDGEVPLDRDVVVRWPVARLATAVSLQGARPPSDHPRHGSAFGLLTIVPPASRARAAAVARDVLVLVDTSGSMATLPLEQAKRVASAIVSGLGDADRIELVEFSNDTRAFAPRPLAATAQTRQAATAWIQALVAGGGTEMESAVAGTLQTLRGEAQRQVIMITDGLVGFERAVVKRLLEGLPKGCRFHAIGVGEAANRSLLAPVARAGRGVEIVLGLRDDVDRAVGRILAHTSTPVVVDVAIAGSGVRSVAPSRTRDLYAGAPVHVFVELDPAGGEIEITGRNAVGPWNERIRYAALAHGSADEAIPKLFAREAVEDLEMRGLAGESVDGEILRHGVDFSIATRLTSWIAITTEATVDPRDPSRRVDVPQSLPHGMSAEGLGLRAARDASMAQGFGGQKVGTAMRARVRSAAPMAAAPMGASGGGGFGQPPAPPKSPARVPPPASARFAPPPPPPMGGMAPPPPPPGAPPSVSAPPDAAKKKAKAEVQREAESEDRHESAPADERFDMLKEASADQPAPEPSFRATQTRSGALPPGLPSLKGRLVFASDGALVIELTVDGQAIAHDVDGTVLRVRLRNGAILVATLLVERSARSGTIAPGLVFRITGALPADVALDDIEDVEVTSPHYTITIAR